MTARERSELRDRIARHKLAQTTQRDQFPTPTRPAPRRGHLRDFPSHYGPTHEARRRRIVLDIRLLALKLGRAPTAYDDQALTGRARYTFGLWADAIEAAGFPRPARVTERRKAAS